jgi:hypothetical protein
VTHCHLSNMLCIVTSQNTTFFMLLVQNLGDFLFY